jgi:drug/metabolite transporter (DMT)-like permease
MANGKRPGATPGSASSMAPAMDPAALASFPAPASAAAPVAASGPAPARSAAPATMPVAARAPLQASGIAAGIAAGAMWGLVFIAPRLAPDFHPVQLSAGRYLAYGLVAAVLVAPSWRRLAARLTGREWWALVWLSLLGNILYYVLLAQAVQQGGVAMASLMVGLLPVAVTLAGSRHAHAAPLRRLLPSVALSLCGLACIGWQSLSAGGVASLAGLLCAVGALASWTLYAVYNSRCLGRLQSVSAREWSLLTGVVTGAEALLLAPASLASSLDHTPHQWLVFAGVVASMALLCSVAGNALWNHASRVLPLALTGQMIVFETLFAMLYGCLWEQRWPSALEWAALALLVAGVVSCTRAHRHR